MEEIFCKELQEMKSRAMGILPQEAGYRQMYIDHYTEEMGLALLEPPSIRLRQTNTWLQTRGALAGKWKKCGHWKLSMLCTLIWQLKKMTVLIDKWYPQAKAIAMKVLWQYKIFIPDNINVLSDENERKGLTTQFLCMLCQLLKFCNLYRFP